MISESCPRKGQEGMQAEPEVKRGKGHLKPLNLWYIMEKNSLPLILLTWMRAVIILSMITAGGECEK